MRIFSQNVPTFQATLGFSIQTLSNLTEYRLILYQLLQNDFYSLLKSYLPFIFKIFHVTANISLLIRKKALSVS